MKPEILPKIYLFFWTFIWMICVKKTESIKCYTCEYNINYCKTPHCYNNYDICSANQFAAILVPLQDCPRNCMMKAVTNPAGIVLKWKRMCAPRDDLTKGYNCRIDYVFGARIEQCTCDKDFCNSSPMDSQSILWLLLSIRFFFLLFSN